MSVDEKFWRNVDTSGECWTWKRYVDRHGYGKLGRMIGGKVVTFFAHRFAFELEYGRKPEKELHHTCQNRSCVRPSHLVEVDHKNHGLLHLRTLCRKGHRMTDDNVVIWGGVRYCKKCRKANRERLRESHALRVDAPV